MRLLISIIMAVSLGAAAAYIDWSVDLLLMPELTLFTLSLALVMVLFCMEMVGLLVGFGLSHIIHAVLPDVDLDIDSDLDVDGGHSLLSVLTWFNVGRVPLGVLVILLMTCYGITGVLTQAIVIQVTGYPMPGVLAGIVVFLLSLPPVKFFGNIIGDYMPRDETYVVSEDDLLGQTAEITLGTATVGTPASAKITDLHGTTHYPRVEPDKHGEEFKQGERVILVSRDGSVYKAIRSKQIGHNALTTI